jgi:hypothetical protein
MRMIRIGAAGLFVACAMSVAASGASAASPPEWGQCVLSPNHAGEFVGARCTSRTAKHNGAYEWVPEPSAKPKFSDVGEAISLETTGKRKVTCAGSTQEGSYTGPKTEKTVLTLIGCDTKIGAESVGCRSNPAKEGELESSELAGEIGFVTIMGKKAVALDLKPASAAGGAIFTFTCGHPGGPPAVAETVEGSVLGRVTPINGMAEELKVTYTQTGPGKQSIQSFEGGPTDTLSTKLVSGIEPPITEETSLKMKTVQTNEEKVEVATIA